MDGIAIGPDGGEWIEGTTRAHRVLCELPELEAIELRFGPEFEGVDLHTHDDHTDCFYVLDGQAQFTIGGETLRAGPGSFVAAPSGTVHGFRVAGDGDLRVLNIHAPNTGFIAGLRDDR
jgi:quercetin dioxygenase-like cupin family protein